MTILVYKITCILLEPLTYRKTNLDLNVHFPLTSQYLYIAPSTFLSLNLYAPIKETSRTYLQRVCPQRRNIIRMSALDMIYISRGTLASARARAHEIERIRREGNYMYDWAEMTSARENWCTRVPVQSHVGGGAGGSVYRCRPIAEKGINFLRRLNERFISYTCWGYDGGLVYYWGCVGTACFRMM